MKAQELRIGNHTDKGVIKSFYERGIHVGHGKTYSFNELNPIPLTEQWLIYFGLLQAPNHKCFHIKGMEFDLPIMSGGYHDNECGLDEENRITLFYVHQLQNLYFALTGEELQL